MAKYVVTLKPLLYVQLRFQSGSRLAAYMYRTAMHKSATQTRKKSQNKRCLKLEKAFSKISLVIDGVTNFIKLLKVKFLFHTGKFHSLFFEAQTNTHIAVELYKSEDEETLGKLTTFCTPT